MTIRSSTIQLAGITKRFDGHLALDDIDITVAAGSFTAVLGPSGSGKSTLLMTIAGFQRPDVGKVLVDGLDITALAAEKRGIGVVFQGYALFPHMNVAENIAYPLRARGMKRAVIDDKVRDMARLMEIEPLLKRLPSEISGGQRQRVAIARALVFEPYLLLLDEPLSALDRNLRDRMKEELRRVHKKLGVTIVMVTHDQDEAAELADRVVVMDKGAVIADGAPRDLYLSPRTTKVAAFFGRANLLAVTAATAETITVGGATIERSLVPGEGQTVLIRPEWLQPLFEPTTMRCLTVTVETIVFRSGRLSISGPTKAGETVAADFSEPSCLAIVEGDTIHLQISNCALVSDP
jgi:putative spermidine/putrescine transport system ATP-binding protein